MNSYRLKIFADDAFLQQLKHYSAQAPDDLKVVSEKIDRDATRQGFDLTNIVEVVVAVSHTIAIIELARHVVKWVRGSKGNKVVVQTPVATMEFHKETISEEEIQKFLEAAKTLAA